MIYYQNLLKTQYKTINNYSSNLRCWDILKTTGILVAVLLKLFRKEYIMSTETILKKHGNCQITNIMNLVNTYEFYYLIGLITTDGTIRYPDINYSKKCKHYVASIEISILDSEVLKKIYNYFGGTIFITHKNRAIKWEIRDRDFILYLKNIVGLTPKKSITLNINIDWFNNLSEDQQFSFLLGCYDGDGSIIKNNRKHIKRPYISIEIVTCSKLFLTFLSNFFIKRGYYPKYTTYYPKKINRHTSYKLCFYGKNAINPMFNIFNSKSSIYLKRKRERYIEYKNYYML
jgi:hypothetical protein